MCGSLSSAAQRILWLRMEEVEGSCEYTEKQAASSRQGVVLQLGG
jgi:hypothetical protein